MKSYICLTALALVILAAGCAPRLAETPLGKEEKRWEGYIKKSYPAWKPPQTIPPGTQEAKIEKPAAGIDAGKAPESLPTVKDDLKLVDDVVVTDPKGKVVSEKITTLDVKEKFQVYVVQKKDSLWKISQKFYKDGKKWKLIQAANNDVLKGSDKVRPGMTLRIPSL